ncbi:hypothetical protein TIFTF001_016572 [Ficus carica]|uniref:Retrotransposon gag domain-containing protein n=1 Tax=Ficus carica TaxID=3494 RepID=A0AA88ANY8_FICCA|nr:hypothetical protein TIFTF001_016572 [Ficus carica]
MHEHELDVANNNLVDYNDSYESDDEIDDVEIGSNNSEAIDVSQKQEIGGLRAQLAQQNQRTPGVGIPPAPLNQPTAPEIPNADSVISEYPVAPEVPITGEPLAVPLAPPVQTPEELYDKFRHMKALKFEGSANPNEADNCLMTWENFVDEFKEKYFNTEIMETQQDEFNSFCQVNLFVTEAVKKFEQLAHLCPYFINSERDKKCGKKHLGDCRVGNNSYFLCGKEGHYAKNCYSNPQNQQNHQRGQGNQLHAAQLKLKIPAITQGRLEAPKPHGHIYAYTKEDVQVGPSMVVIGQLPLANQDAYVLIDYGATHSFTSLKKPTT